MNYRIIYYDFALRSGICLWKKFLVRETHKKATGVLQVLGPGYFPCVRSAKFLLNGETAPLELEKLLKDDKQFTCSKCNGNVSLYLLFRHIHR